MREDKPMAYIAFIAVLSGAAGVVGGIERGSAAGSIAAAVIHIGGIIGMAVSVHREEQDCGADKPAGEEDDTC